MQLLNVEKINRTQVDPLNSFMHAFANFLSGDNYDYLCNTNLGVDSL